MGVLLTGVVGVLFTIWAWFFAHFAPAASIVTLEKRLEVEVSERKELKAQVDQIYMYLIPPQERFPIRYPGNKKGPSGQ